MGTDAVLKHLPKMLTTGAANWLCGPTWRTHAAPAAPQAQFSVLLPLLGNGEREKPVVIYTPLITVLEYYRARGGLGPGRFGPGGCRGSPLGQVEPLAAVLACLGALDPVGIGLT